MMPEETPVKLRLEEWLAEYTAAQTRLPRSRGLRRGNPYIHTLAPRGGKGRQPKTKLQRKLEELSRPKRKKIPVLTDVVDPKYP